MELPKIGQPLTKEQLEFLKTFTKSCRKSILQMVTNAQSGHPGGSLSSIDYLATVYAYIISQTGNKIVISNGHISPAVYSTLGEMGYINKKEAVENFRKAGSIFEGHITRHVDGVWYGTGPLGIGVSVASGLAWGEKHNKTDEKVFGLLGDGEAQEGQVHEMINFAHHYKLNNLILFVDYNKVQLTASLKEVMDIDIRKTFEAGHFHIIEVDAHNFEEMWNALSEAYEIKDKPVVILGHSIMGKGSDFMEPAGVNHKSDWHGKAAKHEELSADYTTLTLTAEEEKLLENFRKNNVKWHPEKNIRPELLSEIKINSGKRIIYPVEGEFDCRTAYGKALLDLAKLNPNILAMTADLKGSVMTKFVDEELPAQHLEVGIAEQHMISVAGGLSLTGFVPFASTFGAFMTSRAKDQARVNDINYTNVKMVATHCGLSVGEDGPTHQAIDDAGSFLGFFNTMLLEPADANQTDIMIRYMASHYGNFYMRMGRHKFPIIKKEDGSAFYDENYQYVYGRSDTLREGKDMTLIAIGSMVTEALRAHEQLKNSYPNISIELIAATSIKEIDDNIIASIKKTKKVITVEDHNTFSGLGSQIARMIQMKNIAVDKFKMMGVEEYQLSGKVNELYEKAGIGPQSIAENCLAITQE